MGAVPGRKFLRLERQGYPESCTGTRRIGDRNGAFVFLDDGLAKGEADPHSQIPFPCIEGIK